MANKVFNSLEEIQNFFGLNDLSGSAVNWVIDIPPFVLSIYSISSKRFYQNDRFTWYLYINDVNKNKFAFNYKNRGNCNTDDSNTIIDIFNYITRLTALKTFI